MLTKRKKQAVIKKSQKNSDDTGSERVQIAILSGRMTELANHLKKNKKDNHSRRGLVRMVENRRKHLKYLKKTDQKHYEIVLKGLKLKK